MTASRLWTVGAVALIAAILALGWFLGIAPLLAQASTADAERVGVEGQTAAQRAQLEVMKADFARLDEILAELDPLQDSIPEYEGTELFAAYVSTVAAQHEITVTSYVASEMPFGGAVVEGEATTTSSGTGGPALTTAAGTVYALPITIAFEGTPEAVTDAVRTLQSGPRLFLVQNLSFSRGTGGTPSATVSGYIFLLTDRALAATPDQAAATPADGVPGTTYQVPDLEEAMPEWLGGDGEAPNEVIDGATPTPTPTPTETPTP